MPETYFSSSHTCVNTFEVSWAKLVRRATVNLYFCFAKFFFTTIEGRACSHIQVQTYIAGLLGDDRGYVVFVVSCLLLLPRCLPQGWRGPMGLGVSQPG